MSTQILNLLSFEKAVDTLQEAINAHAAKPNDKFIRDACIQRFEYTYELTVKNVRRFLVLTEPSEDSKQFSFQDLIRLALDRHLLKNELSAWVKFRDARNITSHTYDEVKADEIIEQLPTFLQEVRYCLEQLKKQNGGT